MAVLRAPCAGTAHAALGSRPAIAAAAVAPLAAAHRQPPLAAAAHRQRRPRELPMAAAARPLQPCSSSSPSGRPSAPSARPRRRPPPLRASWTVVGGDGGGGGGGGGDDAPEALFVLYIKRECPLCEGLEARGRPLRGDRGGERPTALSPPPSPHQARQQRTPCVCGSPSCRVAAQPSFKF